MGKSALEKLSGKAACLSTHPPSSVAGFLLAQSVKASMVITVNTYQVSLTRPLSHGVHSRSTFYNRWGTESSEVGRPLPTVSQMGDGRARIGTQAGMTPEPTHFHLPEAWLRDPLVYSAPGLTANLLAPQVRQCCSLCGLGKGGAGRGAGAATY